MESKPLPKVGDCWAEDINQAKRLGSVVAVDEERRAYLWEYEMPAGTSAMVLYREGYRRRTVSLAGLSDRWMRIIQASGVGLDGLVANPQNGMTPGQWRQRVDAFKAKHPELFAEEGK